MDEQHIANDNAPRRRRRAAAQEKAFEAFRIEQELEKELEQKAEQEAVIFPPMSEEEPPHFEKQQVDWLDDDDVFDIRDFGPVFGSIHHLDVVFLTIFALIQT